MVRGFIKDCLNRQRHYNMWLWQLLIVVVLALLAGQSFGVQAQTSYPVQLTATAYASNSSPYLAASQAEQAARANLTSQAQQAGQSCINMTSSSSYVTTTPIGTYVYQGTATASCTDPNPPTPTPVPTLPPVQTQRSATAYASNSNPYLAASQAEQAARASLTAQAQQAGATCWNMASSSSYVTVTPIGTYVYQGTATATCDR